MLSFVVCLWRDDFYRARCRPALQHQVKEYGAELIEVRSDNSLFNAYEVGRRQASFETIVYIHDDVELLDADTTERVLMLMAQSGAGVLGVVGSDAAYDTCPWWEAHKRVGGWCYVNREGEYIFQDAPTWLAKPWRGQRHDATFSYARLLDGIFLADRTNIPWPERPGYHGYDVDRCCRAREAGWTVAVGDILVAHHSPAKPPGVNKVWQAALKPALEGCREEWGLT